ncbi:tetratricopeptide repeat protein [Magnetococcales bacterium HHB-1]
MDRMRITTHSAPFFYALTLLLLLSGCVTTETPPTTYFSEKADRLERQARSSIQSQEYDTALTSLKEAHKIHTLRDDQKGLLRTELGLTRLYLVTQQKKKAITTLKKATRLLSDQQDKKNLYNLHLLLGKIYRQQKDFQTAHQYAQTPLEKAITHTYLKQYKQAYNLLNKEGSLTQHPPNEVAFIFYMYGKNEQDIAALKEARQYYQRADNFFGIADTLLIMGRLYAKQNRITNAKEVLLRAQQINQALDPNPDNRRTKRVQQELKTLDPVQP